MIDCSILTGLEWIPVWLLIVALVWSIIWKGIALWNSARHSHAVWFIVFLLVNTLGLLEIIYIAFFQPKSRKAKARKGKKKKRK